MTNAAAMRLYVDTNIFIQVFEDQHPRLVALFDGQAADGFPYLVTSLLTRAELLVKPFRDQNEELIQIYETWTTTNAIMAVAPVDAFVLHFAAILRAQYGFLKLPDAIHAATAISYDCTHFLSTDRALFKISNIRHTRLGVTQTGQAPKFLSPETEDFIEIVAMFQS
jgi:predicted nucleic acid-binding protein